MVAVGLLHRRRGAGAAAIAAAAAGLALVLTQQLAGHGFTVGDLTRLVLLLSLAAAVPRLTGALPPRAPRREPAAPRPGPEMRVPPISPTIVPDLLELVRHATGADEAVLWEADASGGGLRPAHVAGGQPGAEPGPLTHLEGHPYQWAISEQLPVHLERGRKPLPREFAAEMLLLPVEKGRGLLALAFAEPTPGAAEAAALVAADVMGHVRALLRVHTDAERHGVRLRALSSAVHQLPTELQPERFADVLARTLLDLTGAEGAAVALWSSDDVQGTIVALHGSDAAAFGLPAHFRDQESRLAFACKFATPLEYENLPSETQRIPLCIRGERWQTEPRSVMIRPIRINDRVLGGLVVWHSVPGRFRERDQESLDLLCSVAAPSLQTVLQFDLLDRRAAIDALTGLPNRGTFDARFAAVSAHFQRYARPFSIVVVDVDHFKRVNDTWGHETGDRVLQHVAALLRGGLREVDLCARLGGEEFVMLLPETSLDQALAVAERVRNLVETTPLFHDGRRLSVTASFGVAACPETCVVATETLADADAALYHSKESGRNRVSAAAPRR